MCEVIFITKDGSFKEQFQSLDEVAGRAATIPGLRGYRCYQIYGNKRQRPKERATR